jgi:hypothetical protein
MPNDLDIRQEMRRFGKNSTFFEILKIGYFPLRVMEFGE